MKSLAHPTNVLRDQAVVLSAVSAAAAAVVVDTFPTSRTAVQMENRCFARRMSNKSS